MNNGLVRLLTILNSYLSIYDRTTRYSIGAYYSTNQAAHETHLSETAIDWP